MKKILLVGDSIRQGYDKYVKMAFEDVAEVYYPSENSRFVMYVCRCLYDWKNETKCGDDVDVVHWNAGLWDDLILTDGKHLTSIEIYKEYVDRACNLIKILFPKAKMIFATSTPIQEHLYTGAYKRFNEDTEEYNQVAIEVVKSYGGEINDLYSIAEAAPVECYSDMAHFYTKEGTQILTEQVVKCLEEALDIKAKRLDYGMLFAEKERIVGI